MWARSFTSTTHSDSKLYDKLSDQKRYVMIAVLTLQIPIVVALVALLLARVASSTYVSLKVKKKGLNGENSQSGYTSAPKQ